MAHTPTNTAMNGASQFSLRSTSRRVTNTCDNAGFTSPTKALKSVVNATKASAPFASRRFSRMKCRTEGRAPPGSNASPGCMQMHTPVNERSNSSQLHAYAPCAGSLMRTRPRLKPRTTTKWYAFQCTMQGNVAFSRSRSGSKRYAWTSMPSRCAARAMLPALAPSRPTPHIRRSSSRGIHLPQ